MLGPPSASSLRSEIKKLGTGLENEAQNQGDGSQSMLISAVVHRMCQPDGWLDVWSKRFCVCLRGGSWMNLAFRSVDRVKQTALPSVGGPRPIT